MNKKRNFKLNAYSLTEILIVLCIIGILIYIAVPDQTATIGKAKAIEAQNMLNMVYSLERNHFFRNGKYSEDMEEVGFQPEKTIEQGGMAVYSIEIIEASVNTFKARATSVQDLDGDGVFNVWEINEERILKETVKD